MTAVPCSCHWLVCIKFGVFKPHCQLAHNDHDDSTFIMPICLCSSRASNIDTPSPQFATKISAALQDVSHNCQGQYDLLPMSQCADIAVTPLGYIACNGSCTNASTNHYVYAPWGSCNATCGGGVQTRTGICHAYMIVISSLVKVLTSITIQLHCSKHNVHVMRST